MTYEEFLDLTDYGENYITRLSYEDFVEPIYMKSDKDKFEFCKWFYERHYSLVTVPVNMLIYSKSIDQLEEYIKDPIKNHMSDVDSLHLTLKSAFLRTLKKDLEIEPCYPGPTKPS